MEINDEDIVGIYILDDGCKYIFLADKTIYKENENGERVKIELNEKNIKKIQREIGESPTDVIR